MSEAASLLTRAATLNARGAKIAIASAEREAGRLGIGFSIAMVDAAGHLLAFVRMEGAPLPSIDVAIAKARTAAHFGQPSKLFQTMVDEGHPSVLAAAGIMPLEGGLPLVLDNEVIGAVGASGGAADQDTIVAEAGIQSIIQGLGA